MAAYESIVINDPLAGSNSNLIGTRPYGLNDTGEVVGTYQSSDGIYHGFLYDSNDDTFTPINDLLATGNFGTQATGINDVGQVVGVYEGAGEVLYGFICTINGNQVSYQTLSVPGENFYVNTTGINNSGEVIGNYEDDNGNTQGFLYARADSGHVEA